MRLRAQKSSCQLLHLIQNGNRLTSLPLATRHLSLYLFARHCGSSTRSTHNKVIAKLEQCVLLFVFNIVYKLIDHQNTWIDNCGLDCSRCRVRKIASRETNVAAKHCPKVVNRGDVLLSATPDVIASSKHILPLILSLQMGPANSMSKWESELPML